MSKTPGHTKHFQTIFLSRTVKLCDCPGTNKMDRLIVFDLKRYSKLKIVWTVFMIAGQDKKINFSEIVFHVHVGNVANF